MNDHNDTTTPPHAHPWVASRTMPGNWYDIAEDDEIPADIEGFHRTIFDMFRIAFSPEIRRRRQEGLLSPDFSLRSAQLLQPLDCKNKVRLNDEIRGIATVRVNRAIEKGEAIYEKDIQGLVDFDLDESELDAGHFTLFLLAGSWWAVFDFRGGRAKAQRLLAKATEFLRAAKVSLDQDLPNASVDALFVACELVVKCWLLLFHSPAARSRRHSYVRSTLNRMAHWGSFNEPLRALFNRLFQERNPARYGSSDVASPSQDDFRIVESEIKKLQESVKRHRAFDAAT